MVLTLTARAIVNRNVRDVGCSFEVWLILYSLLFTRVLGYTVCLKNFLIFQISRVGGGVEKLLRYNKPQLA